MFAGCLSETAGEATPKCLQVWVLSIWLRAEDAGGGGTDVHFAFPQHCIAKLWRALTGGRSSPSRHLVN